MTIEDVPSMGKSIPVEKFHISKLNIRFGMPFGDSEEDKYLIENLHRGKIITPFKARPENSGYGVIVGRRRFLAKKMNGAKSFVNGIDCVIEKMTDDEAREASLVENLELLRKTMNPITRAKGLDSIMRGAAEMSLRATAERLGIPPSNLSEWLSILNLSPKLQNAISEDRMDYTDGLRIHRLSLDENQQDELAKILTTKGQKALKKEISRLQRINSGKKSRGIPPGIYEVVRVTWDKRKKRENKYFDALSRAASKKGITIPEYIKYFIKSNIEKIEKESD